MIYRKYSIFIFIIIIVIIIVLGIRQIHKINGVLFFEHQYESIINNGNFKETFYFLTDRNNDVHVEKIQFDNLDTPLYGHFASNHYLNMVQYKYYVHKIIYINTSLSQKDIDKLDKGPIVLSHATITLTDGSTERVNLGEIVLTKDDFDSSIIGVQGLKSSDGTSNLVFSANGKKTISELSSYFLYDILNSYDISIAGKNISNETIQKDDSSLVTDIDVINTFILSQKRIDYNPYVYSQYCLNIDFGSSYRKAYFINYPTINDNQLSEFVKSKKDINK